MKEELDKKLVENYPTIFGDRYEAPQKTAMCWGFSCGDGWYNLIDTLCDNIESEVDRRKCPPVIATQVKEKFGTLRFYYTGGNDAIRAIVMFAEDLSATMCEECGAPAETRDDGWVRTLCDKHANNP